MATLRQYSDRTNSELRTVLERARQDPTFAIGQNNEHISDSGREARWFRTETNAITTSYPAFVDAKGIKLPCKLLKTTYDSGAGDPVTVATVDDTTRSWYLYSPYGWIPRYIDILAVINYGLWVPAYVPELEVTLSGAITAGSSGTVSVVKHGSADAQTFTAYFDHMDAGTTAASGAEARVALMPGEKKWRIINLGCE